MTDFNKSEVKLISATELDEKVLTDYLQKTFPHRKESLPKFWKWINNSKFYDHKIPLILLYQGELIGYMGLKPVGLKIHEDRIIAGWAIDLRVDIRFRNKGLGQVLSKRLFDFADVLLGFPNDKSGPLLKKIGWVDGGICFTYFFPLQPFEHPRFKRVLPQQIVTALNKLVKPFFHYKYIRQGKTDFEIKEINKKVIDDFIIAREFNDNTDISKNLILPERNEKFLFWRILESPNFSKYKLFSLNGVEAIILINNNRGDYIDILSISSYKDLDLVYNLIASVCFYASIKNLSYVRVCVSDEKLGVILKRNLPNRRKKYNFIYYVKDKLKGIDFKNYKWHWELIDGDFEYIEPKDSLYE